MTKEELKQYIDDNIYENQDGEITGEALNAVLKAIVDDGGTEVEANPTGEATTTLNKIKIGETNYNIPQTDTSNLATKQELQQGLSGKQDTIADLEQIRTRADEGHTALQPSATIGLLKNDGTVDTQTAGRAESALQPLSGAQENNFASFDSNGGIKDSNCNEGTFIKGVQQNGVDLQKDSNGKVNVTVQEGQDGEDGLSAFEIAQQQGYTGTVDQWLASLKANIGAFKFVSYDQSAESAFTTGGIGTTYSNTIDSLVAGTDTTPDVILLMNNTDGTTQPTKTFMIATQEAATAGTYEFIYAGDLQSAMPSNVLTEDDIDNDYAGGNDKVASAEEVKRFNVGLYGGSYEEDIDLWEELFSGEYYLTDTASIGQSYTPSKITAPSADAQKYKCIKLALTVGEKITVSNKTISSNGLGRIVVTNQSDIVLSIEANSTSIVTSTIEATQETGNINVYINFYAYNGDFTGQSLIKSTTIIVGGKLNEMVKNVGYLECESPSDEDKSVSCQNFVLSSNIRLKIKFSNKNTKDNPTLNINGSGAKAIYYNGSVASSTNSWEDGEVVDVYYDGSYHFDSINVARLEEPINKVNEELGELVFSETFNRTGNERVSSPRQIGHSGEKVEISLDIESGEDNETWRIYGCSNEGAINVNQLIATDISFGSIVQITVPNNGWIAFFTTKNSNFTTNSRSYHGAVSTIGTVYDKTKCISSLYGKTIVCFGDSLTEFGGGIYAQGGNYPNWIKTLTGANTISVGIGGTQLRQREDPGANPSSANKCYAALDIVNMVAAATSNDYTRVTAAAQWLKDNTYDNNTEIVTRFSNIDWNKVDIVTIFGGTNDWVNNGGNTGDETSTDISTTCGAINKIVELLCATYPQVKVYFITPIIRAFFPSFNAAVTYNIGDYCLYSNKPYVFIHAHTGAWDANDVEETELSNLVKLYSSDVVEKNGTTLKEFCEIIKDTVKFNHIPIYDLYNELGWNAYNFKKFFAEINDSTHPYAGFKWIGEKIAQFISSH